MGTSWNQARAFGELRSLAHGAPSVESFERVCALVDELHEREPGLYEERWAAWLGGALGRWPARFRVMTLDTKWSASSIEHKPWWALSSGVTLECIDLSDTEYVRWFEGEVRAAFPNIEHLGLRGVATRKRQVERLCASGVFDGLASIAFTDCDLRRPTFERIVEALEDVDALEHLSFGSCCVGKHFERVFSSPLVPKLRSFGVSGHRSVDATRCKQFAKHAPSFEQLEELDLRWCGVNATGAKLLAQADWPATMRRLSLDGNRIRGTGLSAFIDEGRGSWLCAADGVLNLSGQTIGARGLESLAESGLCEGLEVLDLSKCGFPTFEPLAELDLSRLRVLRSHGNSVYSEDYESLTNVVKRATSLEELDVNVYGVSDAFVLSLLDIPRVASYRRLVLRGPNFGPDVVRALLDWPGFDAGQQLYVHCVLDEGDPLLEEAYTSEHVNPERIPDLDRFWVTFNTLPAR